MKPLMLKDKQSAVELQTGLNRKDGADNRSLHNSNRRMSFPGNSRETIFFCRTKEKYETLESPVSDFEINGKTFEVGGRVLY